MVLDFGMTASGLFPSSNSAGFGLGGDTEQGIIDDGNYFSHWWDNTLPRNSTSDYTLTNTGGGGYLTIVGDTVEVGVNLDAGFDSASIVLANPPTSGKFVALLQEHDQQVGEHLTIDISIGNASDGWTSLYSTTALGLRNFLPYVEGIYIGGGKWNVSVGGIANASNPFTLSSFNMKASLTSRGTNASETGQIKFNKIIVK